MATPAAGPAHPRKVITIQLDRSGAPTIDPKDDPFHVSKSRDEEVAWECSDPNAHFTVNFDKGDGSPFYESQFSCNSACSGLVRRDVPPNPGKVYNYTVRMNGKVLDPGGVVDP